VRPAADRPPVMAPRNPPLVRRSILLFAAAGLGVAGVACALVASKPTPAVTPAAMGETRIRIEQYFQRNKQLPEDLSALSPRAGYWNRTTDQWDRPLRYVADSGDSFTLSSLGADGTPGGAGDDADLVQKYRVAQGEVRPVP
jgi:hypothetical protein